MSHAHQPNGYNSQKMHAALHFSSVSKTRYVTVSTNEDQREGITCICDELEFYDLALSTSSLWSVNTT